MLLSGLMLSGGCLPDSEYVGPRDLSSGEGSDMRGGADDMRPPIALMEVRIPGGTFQMGTAPDGGGTKDEQPEYTATLASYSLGVTEVTVEQYGQCVAAGACQPAGTAQLCNAGQAGRERHPINCITWVDADAFCRWARRRLPTEEEWEYAARGMIKSEYPWGNDVPSAQLCWKQSSTCPVGMYRKTQLGAYLDNGVADLAGNVGEWTASEYSQYPKSKPCMQSSPSCVLRGASWFNSDPRVTRAAYRDVQVPATRSPFFGVRCANGVN